MTPPHRTRAAASATPSTTAAELHRANLEKAC